MSAASGWPSLLAARAAFAGGECLPSALLAACRARCERANPQLNALVALDWAAAASAAQAADRCYGEGGAADWPLLGIPFSVKDSFATAGLPTTAGHPPLRDYRPSADASVVARLRAAGGILVGKSNLAELAGDPQCWNPLFGPTRNPWGAGLTPGGSSGGSAVAVAMGFSLLDLGSDIGGSIRIPAAYCGVAGFKASENRIPRSGHIPQLPGQPRTVRHLLSFGALARSCADLALALPLLCGPDGLDSEVPPLPWRAVPPPVQPLRLAYWREWPGLPLCPRTRQGLAQAVARLRAQGQRVEEVAPPWPLAEAWRLWGEIAGSEIGAGAPAGERGLMRLLTTVLPRRGGPLAAFVRGFGARHVDYARALAAREEMIAAFEAQLAGFDALLCPVAALAPYPAFRAARWRPPPKFVLGGETVGWAEAAVGCCLPFSLTGSPALSLPAAVVEGLPVGLQLVGRRWQDEALLAVGRAVESLLWPAGLPYPPLAGAG